MNFKNMTPHAINVVNAAGEAAGEAKRNEAGQVVGCIGLSAA